MKPAELHGTPPWATVSSSHSTLGRLASLNSLRSQGNTDLPWLNAMNHTDERTSMCDTILTRISQALTLASQTQSEEKRKRTRRQGREEERFSAMQDPRRQTAKKEQPKGKEKKLSGTPGTRSPYPPLTGCAPSPLDKKGSLNWRQRQKPILIRHVAVAKNCHINIALRL